MAIYVPGRRDRHNRRLGSRKRSVVAILSLTAMVDMFTVLVIFLLQSYASDVEVIYVPKDVELPKATAIKELKPAHVVILSNEDVWLDEEVVGKFSEVKAQEEWVYEPLRKKLEEAFLKDDQEREKARGLGNRIRTAVNKAKDPQGQAEEEEDNSRKITLQADRKMDILSVKKMLMTISEAGAREINFAVIKKEETPTAQ